MRCDCPKCQNDRVYLQALAQAFREGFSGDAAYEQAAAIAILGRELVTERTV